MSPQERGRLGYHKDFKLIVGGRELPFPMLRIVGIFLCGFIAGVVLIGSFI